MPHAQDPKRWDVICRVVDHLGDAGVCLRLARALAASPRHAVRLLADQPETVLALIQPRPVGDARTGWLDRSGVRIADWGKPLGPADEPLADVVVETFGGGLPPGLRETLLAARATGHTAPLWVNLEHLSAEDWVEGCHTLPSPQAGGLTRWFLFPGFSERTAGLCGPADLAPRLPPSLAALLAAASDEASERRTALVGRPPLTGSLFCYRDSPLPALLAAMQHGPRQVRLLVPADMPGALGGRPLGAAPGAIWRGGQLSLVRVPFLDQDVYDALLAACDLNLVRGEDSFVRAQWAARPLLWAAYRQDADAHRAKVEAWLQRCAMPPAWAALQRWFNGGAADAADPTALWAAALAEFDAAHSWASGWRERLLGLPRLERALVEFALRHASPLQ